MNYDELCGNLLKVDSEGLRRILDQIEKFVRETVDDELTKRFKTFEAVVLQSHIPKKVKKQKVIHVTDNTLLNEEFAY